MPLFAQVASNGGLPPLGARRNEGALACATRTVTWEPTRQDIDRHPSEERAWTSISSFRTGACARDVEQKVKVMLGSTIFFFKG